VHRTFIQRIAQRTLGVAYRGRLRVTGLVHNSRYAASRFKSRHAGLIELACWAIVVALVALAIEPLQHLLAPLILPGSAFAGLQTLIVGVGGAMIGATAIVSSFVLFAMQVNIERLPYALFYRFSSDGRLLTIFGASFAVAIAGTALSLVQDQGRVALVIVLGVGALLVNLRLLLQAFRRSLLLVNPVQQLRLLCKTAARATRPLEKRLGWLTRLSELSRPASEASGDRDGKNPKLDTTRAALLEMNAGWDRQLRQAIGQAVAYARRAGEHADLEVSAEALLTVVELNRLYVRVKGTTFHANILLFDNPLVSDGFVNFTLEEVRQLQEITLARKDERHTQQIYRTYLAPFPPRVHQSINPRGPVREIKGQQQSAPPRAHARAYGVA
jgi:hypothetical protein